MLAIPKEFNPAVGAIAPFLVQPPTQLQPGRSTGSIDRLEECLARGTLRGVEAKEHLFVEGDPKAFVYTVVTGAVCLYRVLSDGRRQIVDFAYSGDVIGLDAGATEAFSALAAVATRVRCVPIETVRTAAARDPSVAMRLVEALSRQIASLSNHLVWVGQRDATERVANFLLTLSHRNEDKGGDPRTIELRITRHDIADYLGLTIETVSRTFSKLKASGVIGIDQGTTITISDMEQLEELADGAA